MKLSPGCGSMSGKVARLNKSLYGLKQASRTLYKRLVSDLKRIGFKQSMSDPCVLPAFYDGRRDGRDDRDSRG